MKQRLGCRPAVPPRAGPCEGPEAARGRVPQRTRSGEGREKVSRPRTLRRVAARDVPRRRLGKCRTARSEESGRLGS